MSLAKKLRDVVAANFIEIARVDEPPTPPATPGSNTAAQTSGPSTMPTSSGDRVAATNEAVAAAATQARLSAEAELDSLLAVPIVPASEVPSSSEPAVVAVPAPPPAPPARVYPPLVQMLDAVDAEGSVDFARILHHRGMPPASFTAEQAMNMLTSLPRDLPLRVKRVTVKATLDAIGAVVGATPKDIVGDATTKQEHLEAYLQDLQTETDAEVERLQAEIAERQAQLRDTQKRRDQARDACQSRMDILQQVTVFFDYEEEVETEEQPAETEEQDELPPFMQEDAVRRLLGLDADGNRPEDAASEPPAEAPDDEPATAGAAKKSGRTSRR